MIDRLIKTITVISVYQWLDEGGAYVSFTEALNFLLAQDSEIDINALYQAWRELEVSKLMEVCWMQAGPAWLRPRSSSRDWN